MALQSGFYNAIETNGEYDREYTADEYTDFYNAFLSDGVRRGDDFKVTANGLFVSIGAGYAICGSKWCHNDAIFTFDAAVVPPVGDYSRIDAVFLHVDTTEITRAASFVYKVGTTAADPIPPAAVNENGIFELCLSHILVNPSATSLQITDTRSNPELCGWITSPVGYDDYFNNLDEVFETWFNGTQTDFDAWYEQAKDTLASTTLFKRYTWHTVVEEETQTVTFNIPQYDPTGVDIIDVFVNGLHNTEGVEYTLNGSTITFLPIGAGDGEKLVGADILVVCYKSIDGEGLGSVSEEITELQNEQAQQQQEINHLAQTIPDISGLTAKVNALEAALSTMNRDYWKKIYPVGSIYTSVSSTNPASIFGGQWVAFGSGRTLVGVNSADSDFNAPNKTGGSKNVSFTPQGNITGTVGGHTLTVNEIPAHNHTSKAQLSDVAKPAYLQSVAGFTPTGGDLHAACVDFTGTAGNIISGFKNTGGGASHNHPFTGTFSGRNANINVMQPYVTVYFWRRTA